MKARYLFLRFYTAAFIAFFPFASSLHALTRECVQSLVDISEAPLVVWSQEDLEETRRWVAEATQEDKPEIALQLYLKARLKNHRSLSWSGTETVFQDYLKKLEILDTPDRVDGSTQYNQMKVYAPKALHSSLLVGMIKAHELSHFLIQMQLVYEFHKRYESANGTLPSAREVKRYINPTLRDKFSPAKDIEFTDLIEKLALQEQWEYLQLFPENYVKTELQKLKNFANLSRLKFPNLTKNLDLLAAEIEERDLPLNVWLERARARGHHPRDEIESDALDSATVSWIVTGLPAVVWLSFKFASH